MAARVCTRSSRPVESPIGRKLAARVMAFLGLETRPETPPRGHDGSEVRTALDREIDRQFEVEAPGFAWVTELTYD